MQLVSLVHHVTPLKNLRLPMVQNVMCHWGQGIHYSPSEICTLKIWRRQTSLGCGTAYQLLPRSSTSEIHGLSWKLLSQAPSGVQRSSTTSPRVLRGCLRGGLLAIGIAHVTVTPLVTGGRDTHTPYSCGVVLVFLIWREIVFGTYVLSVQYSCAVVSVFFVVAGKLI